MKTAATEALLPVACSLNTVTPELILVAERYFPKLYIEQLVDKDRYHDGIAARYLVSRLIDLRFGVKEYFPESTPQGLPVFPENIYWSIAYAAGKAFVAADNKPVGVDMERVEIRNPLLFSAFSEKEWQAVGKMDWNHFYKMWTAKQALVKKICPEIPQMSGMDIVSSRGDTVWIIAYGNIHSVTVRRRKGFVVAVA